MSRPLFSVGTKEKIKKEIFLNRKRMIFPERTRSVAWIAHQPSIKWWRAEGRGFKKPAIEAIAAWVSLRVQTMLKRIILIKEVEFEEEPPSMGGISLEHLLGLSTVPLNKPELVWPEAVSPLDEAPRKEEIPEGGEIEYSSPPGMDPEYVLPEVVVTEKIKYLPFVWTDYSSDQSGLGLGYSGQELEDDSPFFSTSLLYQPEMQEGEQDLLKV